MKILKKKKIIVKRKYTPGLAADNRLPFDSMLTFQIRRLAWKKGFPPRKAMLHNWKRFASSKAVNPAESLQQHSFLPVTRWWGKYPVVADTPKDAFSSVLLSAGREKVGLI